MDPGMVPLLKRIGTPSASPHQSQNITRVAGLRFYCYSQLEYVTAAMMSNWVPKGGNGARVVQLGGGARQLYYYPKNTVQVTNVGEGVNKSLMEQAGVQAAVPTLARKQPVWDLSFVADGSVGVGVCLSEGRHRRVAGMREKSFDACFPVSAELHKRCHPSAL